MTPTTTGKLPLQRCVTPADETEVAALITEAYQSGTPVYPIGGGTSLDYGPRPGRAGIGLSMCHMNRVLDHPADDLTITVEPNLTLAELNRHLAAKRQWLPIDAADSGSATVGGIVATNAAGPRRYARGTIGDYLLGFRAIDGRGEAFAGGGRVVKNAAGYNLPRLMVGSLGTLGVLTQLTFMVRPLPICSALVICDLPTLPEAERLLVALGRSHTTPMIVELLAGPAMPRCPLPAMPHTATARLAIGFEGGAADVHAMVNDLCDEWRALGANGLTTITGAGVDSVCQWLSECPAQLQVNVLPSRLVDVMEQLVPHLPATPLQAHAGNGVIRIYRPADATAALTSDIANFVRRTLRPIAVAAEGNLVILATPDDIELTPADIWGPPRPGAALMRSIQQRFDPAGILNPGRL